MVSEYLICPMCGFEFQKTDTLCSHGCPLGAMCSLSRCPSCNYEFPKTPKTLSWLARVFRKASARPLDLPEHVRTLRELKAGERGRVMCLGPTSDRDNSLAVFGLAPGAEITLLQQQPACVVQVGETQLALDPEIAESILVDDEDGDVEWLKGR